MDKSKFNLHEIHIAKATQQYMESLRVLGVNSFIVGYSLSESEEGEGVAHMEGRSPIVLHLIGALIHGLCPEDFHALLAVMTAGDYYAKNRGEKPRPVKKVMVN
jgi:hypothetical protein